MTLHRCLAIAAVLLLPLLVVLDETEEDWHEFVQDIVQNLHTLRPSFAEPQGLQDRLQRAFQRRRISEAEQRVFKRDGALVLRGLVQDAGLLKELGQSMAPHQQLTSAAYRQPWKYNGAVRALVRQVPLVDIAADLLNTSGPVKMREAPIWGNARDWHTYGAWHHDQVAQIAEEPLVSIWIALTEAPHSVEYMLGTQHSRAELLRRCNRSYEGAFGNRLLRHRCLLDAVGEDAFFAPDLRPGDAIAFDGNLPHRSVAWPRARTAIAPRFELFWKVPSPCSNDEGAIIFRHDGQAERPAGLDPLECSKEFALPRPEDLWPSLEDRLLRGRPRLHSLVKAATRVLFSATVDVV